MANNGYRVGALAAFTIVALRVIIGWHFFTAGLEKLEPDFTSAGFLRGANGPLADFYKSLAPLPHNWGQLITEPLPPAVDFKVERRYVDESGELKDKPQKNDREGFIPFPTEAYGPWASQIAEDWSNTVDRFKQVAEVTDEQRKAADKLLDEKLRRLSEYFDAQRGALEEYHHELSRLIEMGESDARGTLPYLDERILKKKAEVEAIPRPWVADIESEEDVFHQQLIALETDDQRESAAVSAQINGAIAPKSKLDTIDTTVMLVTLIVGGCLIVGLFTRLAALVGAGFLLSVMATQPPWSEGVLQTVKLLTAYQGIEFVALLVLAAIGAGTWAGLDGLIWRRQD